MLNKIIGIKQAATLFKLLGDETRLTMMKIIHHEAHCVCEFVEQFNVSQPAISQHLCKLKAHSLVEEERRGQWVFYSVNKKSEFYPLIKLILDQLDDQQYRNDD